MAKLQLNKSSLARETKSLGIFRRFLPSLDLKRKQLTAKLSGAERALAETQQKIGYFTENLGQKVPMMANIDIDLAGLVRLKSLDLGHENLVGTTLPIATNFEIEKQPYALMAQPHWVDDVATALEEMLTLNVHEQVERQRANLLEIAVKVITQRVNLFEKVLIPRAENNIRQIKIYLSDEDMAAVVRSKIAKRKRTEMVQ
ncbi:MAG: V-type ATP synthase subunit D [Kordiimonadaceae bacterium]|nr:V-type ATP synthase subunit D [Kordiimonadaceae bacterium]